jgi:hypothetical protein
MVNSWTNHIETGSQPMSERAWLDAAVAECRSLAAAALMRGLRIAPPEGSEIDHLAGVLDPYASVNSFVERRFARMDAAMLFDTFAAKSVLSKRTFASGIRPGLWERVVTRLRPTPAQPPQGWAQAVVMTALGAPTFLADMQVVTHRGLRRRMLFDADGPPTTPLHPATLLNLIVLAGRPRGLSTGGWATLVAMADQIEAEADAIGPTDTLVLAEARAYYGLLAPDDPSKDGDGDGGEAQSEETDPKYDDRTPPTPGEATEEGPKHVST